jgi:hypothetical protein
MTECQSLAGSQGQPTGRQRDRPGFFPDGLWLPVFVELVGSMG